MAHTTRAADSARAVRSARHPERGGEQGRLNTWKGPIDPEWLIYGRSSSDDKSPIVALLAAVDALDAQGASSIASNVRIILEGEEEAGSPNLAAAVKEYADRIRGDALILVDGPRHASGRATMNFGSRPDGGDDHRLQRDARPPQRQL